MGRCNRAARECGWFWDFGASARCAWLLARECHCCATDRHGLQDVSLSSSWASMHHCRGDSGVFAPRGLASRCRLFAPSLPRCGGIGMDSSSCCARYRDGNFQQQQLRLKRRRLPGPSCMSCVCARGTSLTAAARIPLGATWWFAAKRGFRGIRRRVAGTQNYSLCSGRDKRIALLLLPPWCGHQTLRKTGSLPCQRHSPRRRQPGTRSAPTGS